MASFDVGFACEVDSDGRIFVFCAVYVGNESITAAILIFKVNSAAFRMIFAVLISGEMRLLIVYVCLVMIDRMLMLLMILLFDVFILLWRRRQSYLRRKVHPSNVTKK